MSQSDRALISHLMRRAGFGVTHSELEAYVAKGYDATLEALLHPEQAPEFEEDLVRRYHVDENSLMLVESCQAYWVYRMINTPRPLEEKLALFWHGVFATGYTKLNQPKAILGQIDLFRNCGMGSFQKLLIEISKNPAMIFWLDNKDNHKDAVNENYGRELLELFSMGVGNYTEDDVRQCSMAFTGWTMKNADLHTARVSRDSVWPYGRLDWQFEYDPDDHDQSEKTFLGHQGAFNGEQIIDLICQQPATARFIARHLYTFFVADEVQVPSWNEVPPRDPAAIECLAEAFVAYEYRIRDVLRVLFQSDFFKASMHEKVKSPTELVVGAARLAGGHHFPQVDDINLGLQAGVMGQQLLDPPSVEGWHTGREWINTASLMARVNFAADQMSNSAAPGVRAIVAQVLSETTADSPAELVDACLALLGPVAATETTRAELIAHVEESRQERKSEADEHKTRVDEIIDMLQLIVATREYQLA